MEVKDIMAELDAHPEGTFLQLTGFNGSHVGAVRVTGVSPVWEMHPDTDELFYVLDGEVEFVLLEADDPRTYTAAAGSTFVVPTGIWHKPGAPGGASFMYFTPGTSLHSDQDDPRSGD